MFLVTEKSSGVQYACKTIAKVIDAGVASAQLV